MNYYDPMFYLCSEDMPFGIRIEAELKYGIDGKILENAVNTAIRRYPYFALRIVRTDAELVTVHNDLPVKVFEGTLPCPLGCADVNYHVLALAYSGRKINLCTSHVITDGAGFFPFINTVLYYYLCEYLKTELPKGDIRLVGEPFLAGEIEPPYPEAEMASAEPSYIPPDKECLRLTDFGYVTDTVRTSYNFRAKASDVMKFSHENDASPCALFSALMSKAIRRVHSECDKDIVSAVSFNMRPGLKAGNNHRMLCSAIKVRYPKKLDSADVSLICTCTRGAITLQSQSENVLYTAECRRRMMNRIMALPDVETKCAVLSKIALDDSVDNTFSVSYVGRIDYGALTEHIEAVHNFTDGSTYKTVFIEISSFGEWFCVSMQQGFSCDVYYKALLAQLEENGIEYVEEGTVPLATPGIVLPE